MLLLNEDTDRIDSATACPPRRVSSATSAPMVIALPFTGMPSAPATGVHASFADLAMGRCRSRQTEILDLVAHELRNALQPIRLAAAMLGRPHDPTQLSRSRLIIERQVAHMSRLVDDLLDVARAGNGKLRLELAVVDLADVIAEAKDACESCVTSREQRLCINLPEPALLVRGDRVRLVQILGNLLTNASKYTPRGGTIEVSVVRAQSTLQLTVADNGIGIAADVLPHVFEPFVQDAHAVAFDSAGLGIGLSVVRELVEAHGGKVAARSAGRGLGSQFVVTLPRAGVSGTASERVAAAPPARATPAVAGQGLARRQHTAAET